MPSFTNGIIGECTASRDSRKAATSLTLSMTVSGVFVFTSGTDDSGTTTTFAATTFSRTFTRVPYHPRDLAALAADEFFLLSKCCCWPCRSFLDGADFYLTDDDAWLFPWSSTSTGTDPPADASGTVQGRLNMNLLEPDGRAYFCRAAAEAGRVGVPFHLRAFGNFDDAVAGPGYDDSALGWTYTNTAGQSGSGTGAALGDLATPGPFTDDLQLDFCAETADFSQTTVFAGPVTYPDDSVLDVQDFTITAALSIT